MKKVSKGCCHCRGAGNMAISLPDTSHLHLDILATWTGCYLHHRRSSNWAWPVKWCY